MVLSISQWHQRYLQQARWTQTLRAYLYQKSELIHSPRVLDVGCGTGVLEAEIAGFSGVQLSAIDLDLQALKFARHYSPKPVYTNADCLSLPYSEATFDVTLCHFLLLWIARIDKALNEMIRVTRAGGTVMALAEPDYGGRIDYPAELCQVGEWQAQALQNQGADPFTGRKLRSAFTQAGLSDVEVGVLGGQWRKDDPDLDVELEWQVVESDLQDNAEFLRQSEALKALDLSSRKARARLLFVPVFYAFGLVPK